MYAFQCLLNNKYISPNDNINEGTIQFVEQFSTEKEYFQIVWHNINIVSLITYNETYESKENENNNCLFEIKSKEFNRLNKNINTIPYCQLPIRSINGQWKRDTWLKGINVGYLAFRSQPYRYEAVSQIMGQWNTIRFANILIRNLQELFNGNSDDVYCGVRYVCCVEHFHQQ